MKKVILLLSLVFCVSAAALAQVQPVEQPKSEASKNVPARIEARYEGGMFGFSKREEGVLWFDDENERLVFFGKNGKEKFQIPYKAILIVYPSQKKVQSGTGRTIGSVPILGAGIAGSFMKKKKHYMAIQFDDPDVDAKGTTSFLIDTGDLLGSAIQTLGQKAKLTQRGDAFYRPREEPKPVL